MSRGCIDEHSEEAVVDASVFTPDSGQGGSPRVDRRSAFRRGDPRLNTLSRARLRSGCRGLPSHKSRSPFTLGTWQCRYLGLLTEFSGPNTRVEVPRCSDRGRGRVSASYLVPVSGSQIGVAEGCRVRGFSECCRRLHPSFTSTREDDGKRVGSPPPLRRFQQGAWSGDAPLPTAPARSSARCRGP